MWPFKKKVVQENKIKKDKKKVSGFTIPEIEISKDRFMVDVCVDKDVYKITIYDMWSNQYLPKIDKDKGLVATRTSIFDLDEDIEEKVLSLKLNAKIERIKDELRVDFIKAREKHLKKCEPKKKKKPKKRKE